nr:G protein-coupled receptor [Proales similis]
MLLLKFVSPLILLVGTLGNLVNIFVLTRPNVRNLSTFRFLTYLSIIDLVYLVTGLSHIIGMLYFDYDIRNYSNLICSVHSFLTLYLSHLSSNVLAGVSVFRCVTITTLKQKRATKYSSNVAVTKASKSAAAAADCPSRSNNNATGHGRIQIVPRRSRPSVLARFLASFGYADLMIAVIMFVLLLFNFHYLVWMRLTAVGSAQADHSTNSTAGSKSGRQEFSCFASPDLQPVYYSFLRSTWIWIDLFLYSYIPFSIMIVCTVLIIYRLCSLSRRLDLRESATKPSQSGTTLTDKSNQSTTKATLSAISSQTKRPEKRNLLAVESNLEAPSQVSVGSARNLSPLSSSNNLARRLAKRNRQIYQLLITLNVFFFILVTPLVLTNSLGLLTSTDAPLFDMVYIAAYLNHSLNFLFYGFSCKIYRNILCQHMPSYFQKFVTE